MKSTIAKFKIFWKAQAIVVAGILCFGLALAGGLSHTVAYVYASQKAELFQMNGQTELLNIDMEPATDFSPGDGFNLRYYLHLEPIDCYGIYVTRLSGPVSYQFPPMRTGDSKVDVVSDITVSFHFEIPPQLPAGDYKVMLMTFPTCEGLNLNPKGYDLGLDMTVLPRS